ncbi:MAG: MFS transporter, partial [Chloroflexi bacterium]|nr:MFS transporter [Chloroflexota bacterium]
NLPVAAGVLLLLRWVPESWDEEEQGKVLDWWGAALVTAGLGSLIFGLLTASDAGFESPIVVSALAGAVVLIAAFVVRESKASLPLMPLTLFRGAAFSGANIFTLLVYSALGGALFFLPFNLIQVQGYTPQAAGAALLPFIALMFLLSRWSGAFAGRYGARLPLICGPLLVAAGFVLFARPSIGGSYWTTYFPAVTVMGLGMAIAVAPLTTTVMNSVPGSHSGLASGVNNAVARTAGVLAVAVLGLFVVSAFDRSLDQRLGSLALPGSARQAIQQQRARLAAIEVPGGLDQATRDAAVAAIDAAFVDGFRLAMFVAAGLALAASATAVVSLRPSVNRDSEPASQQDR